jgi:hypothetical protein
MKSLVVTTFTKPTFGFGPQPRASSCIFGAIRWDAQYCDTEGEPCFEEEKALGDHKWQFRAPLHTRVLGYDKIRFEPSQKSFNLEIIAAEKAGLKYWAYASYGKGGALDLNSSMMRGLAYHRSSSIRDKMKYALIIAVDLLGKTSNSSLAIKPIVQLMKDPNYLMVEHGRPVLFFNYIESLLSGYWNGSAHNLAAAIGALREAAVDAGIGNPYIVLLSGANENLRLALGMDAISIYAITPPSNTNGTYQDLATRVHTYWEREVEVTKGGMIPTVMVGWDTRPRKEHPPAYDHADRSKLDPNAHIIPPTPSEFAAECEKASEFISAHPEQCSSRLALIYAWNEDSEGGPLEPTLGNHSASLLAAAQNVIK